MFGGDVARPIKPETTLAEIDEALRHANAVPETDRGPWWQPWVDSLLDQRNRMAKEPAGL